jgi:hypothetical protein
MMYDGNGGWWVWMTFIPVIWLALIGLTVWVVVRLTQGPQATITAGTAERLQVKSSTVDTPRAKSTPRPIPRHANTSPATAKAHDDLTSMPHSNRVPAGLRPPR